ncbi:aspartate aminotransferase family protein [candidate division KSB1 bacterium]
MGKAYSLAPKDVPHIETRYRNIVTRIPAPQSLDLLEKLRKYEPRSMSGQPPVVWDKADGFQVHDPYGNKWLDFSSGVLVANAGHSHPAIIDSIRQQLDQGLIHNYCFPSRGRAELAEKLVDLAPEGLDKAFILTTGAETTECAIKLSRTYGQQKGGKKKIGIVTFENAFHGRTLASQMAGGIPALKEWIVNLDPDFHQVPFPDGFRNRELGFDVFLETLELKGVGPDRIACVMTESYQGGGTSFAPPAYMQELRQWCDKHDIVLVMDEVQAAFGRTGAMFGFEHYGIVPDLVCLGKGITSSLPLSAVVGRTRIMDQYEPGSMTSTHTGNPISVAAALASIKVIEDEGLVENAREVGKIMYEGLLELKRKYASVIGSVQGKGLVYGVHVTKPDSREPNGDLAFRISEELFRSGLLIFAPVGFGGATIKLSPPLCITEVAVKEGIEVIDWAFETVLA